MQHPIGIVPIGKLQEGSVGKQQPAVPTRQMCFRDFLPVHVERTPSQPGRLRGLTGHGRLISFGWIVGSLSLYCSVSSGMIGRRMLKRLLMLALLAMPPSASATTYHIDNCVAVGNGSNNGTAPSTPWLTVGKVNASTLLPGDFVL